LFYEVYVYLVREKGKLKATLTMPTKASDGTFQVSEVVRGRINKFKELSPSLYPNIVEKSDPYVIRVEDVTEFPVYACRNRDSGSLWVSLNKPEKTDQGGYLFEGGVYMKLEDNKTLQNLTYNDSPIIISAYKEDKEEEAQA
jgi:hypothetical protein